MEALVVIDAQNEFSPGGLRPVPNHADALDTIHRRVAEARRRGRPVAWIRHHNRPDESPGFEPGTWGAELSPGLGPEEGHGPEVFFEKDVYGAFSGTPLSEWLREVGADSVLLVGFYTHMCLATTAREGLVRGIPVRVDPEATGARALEHEGLGRQTADEVRWSALLHLTNMGVGLAPPVAEETSRADVGPRP